MNPPSYTGYDYAQVLDDHQVLGSIGTVCDAYDNAMAESFVDTFKTELIKDRIWRTCSHLELAVLEYVAWFNNDRLHESLGDRPPVEIEHEWAAKNDSQDEPRSAKTAPNQLVDETLEPGLSTARM